MQAPAFSNDSGTSPSVVMFDTRSVCPNDRISYWEEKCNDKVVGLRCTSLEVDGLQARFKYLNLGEIKLIDICGRQHVVERSPDLVRLSEKNSAFLITALSGKAFLNRANECISIEDGDCVLYDTTRPYMHGFPGEMHHLIFELPADDCRRRFPAWNLARGQRFDASLMPGRYLNASLKKMLSQYQPFNQENLNFEHVVAGVWNTLETAYSLEHGARRSTYHILMKERINRYINENLRNPELSPKVIADEIGISVRHLNRLFAGEPESVSEKIDNLRLQKCKLDLERKDILKVSISEIAFGWGFKNLSHFSRHFKKSFGCSPSRI